MLTSRNGRRHSSYNEKTKQNQRLPEQHNNTINRLLLIGDSTKTCYDMTSYLVNLSFSLEFVFSSSPSFRRPRSRPGTWPRSPECWSSPRTCGGKGSCLPPPAARLPSSGWQSTGSGPALPRPLRFPWLCRQVTTEHEKVGAGGGPTTTKKTTTRKRVVQYDSVINILRPWALFFFSLCVLALRDDGLLHFVRADHRKNLVTT